MIKRKHLNIHGKEYPIPRKLSERLYGERQPDLRSSQLVQGNDEVRPGLRFKYRYKPSAFSRYVSCVIQRRFVEDLSVALQSNEMLCGHSLSRQEVDAVLLSFNSDLENRESLQERIFREGYKSSKF